MGFPGFHLISRDLQERSAKCLGHIRWVTARDCDASVRMGYAICCRRDGRRVIGTASTAVLTNGSAECIRGDDRACRAGLPGGDRSGGVCIRICLLIVAFLVCRTAAKFAFCRRLAGWPNGCRAGLDNACRSVVTPAASAIRGVGGRLLSLAGVDACCFWRHCGEHALSGDNSNLHAWYIILISQHVPVLA